MIYIIALLGSVPMNIRLLCFLPALMATILLFMDQNITARIIMAKQNKLKKGSGVHLDMLVVAVVTTSEHAFNTLYVVLYDLLAPL